MRHAHSFRKLNRVSAHRRAMLRNMVTSLLEHEQIKTTDAKAKELRRVVERMITLAKDGGLHARRQTLAYVRSKPVVHKLFSELAERYAGRSGGCVHIYKLGFRRGDGAPMSVVSLVSEEVKKSRRRRRKVTKTEAAPKESAAALAEAKPQTEAAGKKKAEAAKKAKPKKKAAAESEKQAKPPPKPAAKKAEAAAEKAAE